MTTSSQGKLTAADISVIAVYIVSVIAVGIWVSFMFWNLSNTCYNILHDSFFIFYLRYGEDSGEVKPDPLDDDTEETLPS